jgi:hypothetical protein
MVRQFYQWSAMAEPRAGSSIDEIIEIYKRDVDVTLPDERLRRTTPQRLQALQDALTAIEESQSHVKQA